MPIRVEGRTWGSLALVPTWHDVRDEDRLLLEAAVAQIGLALQLCELLERVERTFTDTVGVLSGALEAKDAYTAAHTREVADLAERVGMRLGMSGTELRNLSHAALLHDIGKIAIRGEVLNKPGPLTEAEFDEIKQHTITGVHMLERVDELGAVLPLIRSAHERWDGSGYPDRIAGEAIPLGARVICACDAFHAMTSDRPYRCRDAGCRSSRLRCAVVRGPSSIRWWSARCSTNSASRSAITRCRCSAPRTHRGPRFRSSTYGSWCRSRPARA